MYAIAALNRFCKSISVPSFPSELKMAIWKFPSKLVVCYKVSQCLLENT